MAELALLAGELVLASASPRRHQLLRQLGVDFDVLAADVDESALPGEQAIAYVERVAALKAATVAQRLGAGRARAVVLAADTTVDLDGEILVKPADQADACRMLQALSGRTHQVHTAVVCGRGGGHPGGEWRRRTVTTDVTFGALDQATIDWYLGLGEHADKAGAYAMQGAGAALVRRIEGSPSNVIGLPVAETVELLRWAATI